ncbi:helicase-associated domain-containing protein [Corynebacterium callunae]|uniref:helicase-associated domain-containing protein n=1 Tax=Corynebacterium callunae TaxID=1721 RepID=UPI0039825A2F
MKKDSPVHTLHRWLEQLNNEELSEILRNRPDTVLPLPPNLGSLAARLQLRASALRALLRLNSLELVVLEAAANIGAELHPVTAPEIIEYLQQTLKDQPPPDQEQITAAIARLKSFALIFGRENLMIAQEAMAALPNNWQLLPESRGSHLNFASAQELVEKLSAAHRKILGTLVAAGGFGLTKDAALDADPARPIPQLIAAGLLARVDEQTVKLPAVVRRVLEGRPELPAQLLPVTRTATAGDDDAGVVAGLEVVRKSRLLLDALSQSPAATLKGGGLGVRTLSRLSKELDISEAEVSRVLSICVAAGLLRRGVPDPLPPEDDGGDYIAPTPLADEWLDLELAAQLAVLLKGWWTQTIAPWLVGEPDDKDKPIHLLSAASSKDSLPDSRHKVIAGLSRVARADLKADLSFNYPIVAHRLQPELIAELISEAEWIGAYAGGVTAGARALVEGHDPAEVINAPKTVDYFIVQGDFTIMVPGPLDPAMQKSMDNIATLESPGLASVYRLSEKSIRHALDVGLSTAEILDFLKSHAATELPQSVAYLLSDIARKHGTLRGGPALSYLRSEDPALLHQAVSAGAEVGLHQIAPTVAIAQAPLLQVIMELRKAGFQPVAEDSSGASLNIARAAARVPAASQPAPKAPLDESRIQAAVNAIRREDAATAGVASDQPTLAVLQAAVRGQRTVTLGFVDKQGVAVHRVVKPLTVTAGQVDAVDEATGSVHRFMLHRITEVIVD